jgi:hypothetical protein
VFQNPVIFPTLSYFISITVAGRKNISDEKKIKIFIVQFAIYFSSLECALAGKLRFFVPTLKKIKSCK